ncbi:MAG TPA: M14 family zinc carboxypeptidase [Thermoleophilaceae bacterium]|nr:M14 family zinc carboxypeptidase [Thermoleophilaceae bacterium]
MRFAVLLALAATGTTAAPAVAQTACDPTQTQPEFRGQVPTLSEVVPAPGGENGEVTTDQAYAYMDAVDAASERVITGALEQTSQEGRELRWAIVGQPDQLGRGALRDIKRAAQKLRDPRTSAAHARQIARRYPAILWVASNVHGGEESGTDGSMRVLYELADRDDCAARQILDNSIVVLLPIQNPDGREADTRRNFYGFDMNRDWFARTQPETDGKIEFLREYPSPLFIDAHEMGRATYFFPPNADPVYHEITDESVDWINNVYGAAIAAEFTRQGIPFFNRDVYDLFYMGYGDTVPATGFISAGMTFEKANGDPIERRAYEQYLTQWVSLSAAAVRKQKILEDWAGAWREAYLQGRDGFLEPNELINEVDIDGNPQEIATEVPDIELRHYWITERRASKQDEVQEMIRRLQRMDVDVYQLRRGRWVPDFTPYGRATRGQYMPAGTWYVPMAQQQKHWVQAMLHEDTYTPFPYFYDVTAWSQPLLFNVRGGYSGERLRLNARSVDELDPPGVDPWPEDGPRIALWQLSEDSTSAIESAGWLRWLLEKRWGAPYTKVSTADVKAGALSDHDMVLVPNATGPDEDYPEGDAGTAVNELGADGVQAVQEWANEGGHWISWREGTRLATLLGLSTVTLADPTSDIPGTLLRVRVNEDSPLRRGVGRHAYAFYEYDSVMRASSPDQAAVEFPPVDSGDWFISGFADGAEELSETAAVVDEPVGSGRATVFSVEPNFRAFTTGFQNILRNAILGGDVSAARVAAAGAGVRAAREARARRAAGRLNGGSTSIRLSVRPASAKRAAAVLSRVGAAYDVRRSKGRVAFVIANPRGLTADEHRFAARLPQALEKAGVATIAYRAP